jgi:cytochrome c-type biogenesis protein CcmF
MFIIGVSVVSAFNIESDMAMRPGETLEVAGHTFELRELKDVEGPNYAAVEGVIEIRRDGDFIAEIRPQKRQYLVQKNWMTEAGIQVNWNKDLFIALGDQLGNNTWSVRIQYKPMIRFIWLGALVMALGGLIAVSDRRYRSPARARSSAASAEAG